jgi:Fe-S cluster assembly ATP-binding protein
MLKLKNYSVEGVLENIDIEFEIGKTYVVMGPNGVGKSTLIHSIMGRPDLEVNGDLTFMGSDISELPVDQRARLGMYVAFQAPTSIPGLSNFQMIKQALNLKGSELAEQLAKFRDTTEKFNLPRDWDKRNVNTDASGGEKKKNELIQLSLLNKKLAMLDEPDSGLDVDGVKSLVSFLNEWRTQHNTLIVVTHYDRLIYDLNPDAVIVLKKDGVDIGDTDLARRIFNSGFDNV